MPQTGDNLLDQLELDAEGYLVDLQCWSEQVATAMALEDGITLTPNHWEVIAFLRDYYAEYRLTPPMRILTRAMAHALGREKGNTRYLFSLFPEGPAKQACRYAGLPKPTGCI